jgi:hypothetical protein
MSKSPECDKDQHRELCSNQDECVCECHDPIKIPEKETKKREENPKETKFSNL